MFCASQVLHAGHKFLVLLEHIRRMMETELQVSYDWPSPEVLDRNQKQTYALLLDDILCFPNFAIFVCELYSTVDM